MRQYAIIYGRAFRTQEINKLELFNLADKALYQAKEKGRNGYIIVDY